MLSITFCATGSRNVSLTSTCNLIAHKPIKSLSISLPFTTSSLLSSWIITLFFYLIHNLLFYYSNLSKYFELVIFFMTTMITITNFVAPRSTVLIMVICWLTYNQKINISTHYCFKRPLISGSIFYYYFFLFFYYHLDIFFMIGVSELVYAHHDFFSLLFKKMFSPCIFYHRTFFFSINGDFKKNKFFKTRVSRSSFFLLTGLFLLFF